MNKANKEISTKELTEIIVTAIREEQVFQKDVLIPKIRALISVFRLRLTATEYNSIKKPTDIQRLVRSDELKNLEMDFWKQELKKVVGNDSMNHYYEKLDSERLIWNG